MKKMLLLLGFLSCAAGAGFSQGTVSFNNNGLLAGNPPSILVYNLDGSPLIGTNWLAQPFYGAQGSPESSLIPASGPPVPFRFPTTMLPGTWSAGGTRTLDGFPENSTVRLQVRTWDGSLFPTCDTAFASGGITGKSILFNYTICPAGSCGPPTAYYMSNFRGFTLVDPRPPLSMTLSQNQNQLVLSWPTNFVGFTLQSSPALGSKAHWTPNNSVIAGNQYLVVTIASNAARFYRLTK